MDGQRCRILGGKDKLDRCIASDVPELRRAKKRRQRHHDFAGKRAGKLSDHPANPVWSVDANSAVGLILKVGSKRGHYGKEFAAGQLTVLITYRQ